MGTVRMRGRTGLWLAAVALGGMACSSEETTGPTAGTPLEAISAQAIPPAQVPLYRQVSAGFQYSCGVTPDSLGYCWGAGSSGQLGNGSNGSQSRPVAVQGGIKFRQIDAGSVITCGLDGLKRAWCWGRSPLGDGSFGGFDRLTPVRVGGALRFRQITVGGTNFGFACGLTATNRAYCWGYNDHGQLGIGSTDWPTSPVPVQGGLQFRQLSAGAVHTCGVTTDNRAYCWGANLGGNLGDGTTADRYIPVPVAGSLQFDRVIAGSVHTCGETTTNLVYCWGGSYWGQLGNGSSSGPETCVDENPCSTRPVKVGGGLRFAQVSVGGTYTCAITPLNRAYCWGVGPIGDGTGGPRLIPTAVAGDHLFRLVSAGYDHACAVNPYNRPFCWGGNRVGQLGDGTRTTKLIPVKVASPQ
jgi:alpha-tubulin suppressor-like RCC1 family protein